MNGASLILASASPRREQLLKQLGVDFSTAPQDIVEQQRPRESPRAFVRRMAAEKADAALARYRGDDVVVLAADTIVLCKRKVLGKPGNKREGMDMLLALADRSHRVLSAVTVATAGRRASLVCGTTVYFRPISTAEAERYWETGEPRDKAGGYAIQGLGAVFVRYIKGSYSGVMGLPLFETAHLLDEFGVPGR